MKIININEPLPYSVPSVVTVGNFDGVHLGHTRLIARTAGLARERGGVSVAVTFEPHTRAVLHPELPAALLTTFDEKASLLEKLGINYLLRVDFDDDFRRMDQEEFIKKILAERLRASDWVMGEGQQVGKNRAGGKKNLHFAAGKYHIDILTEPLEVSGGEAISSTRIRGLVGDGRITDAAVLLGRPYLVMAERAAGVKIATELGFPTLNFNRAEERKVIPPAGVYAADIEIDGGCGAGGAGFGGDRGSGGVYAGCVDAGGAGGRADNNGADGPKARRGRIAGALYFGDCPTYSGRETHFEFHALRFNDEDRGREPAAGKIVRLWLHKFIRPNIAFPNESALKGQIEKDVNEIKKYFSEETQ
ncbi:MAG: hypothetical protein LBC70_00275 [Chitinispirillales bacterium]|jgi:riboflavin kinase/FMN adenylyltransferase|nr:hypothetical protein [Chitinispirillales bacterium]